MARTGRSPQAA